MAFPALPMPNTVQRSRGDYFQWLLAQPRDVTLSQGQKHLGNIDYSTLHLTLCVAQHKTSGWQGCAEAHGLPAGAGCPACL